jgi:tetratricopeptide (TPR) repeat protein
MSALTVLTPAPPQAATPADRLQQILHTLGKAYLQRQQYAEAFEKYRELLHAGGDRPEYVLDAATAALGMKNASDEALALYEKALAQNPDSTFLKFGLPALFIERNIASPFAIDLCEKVAELSPESEPVIRLYLKKYYEANGLFDKAQQEEQRAVFSNRDGAAIREYLEKLWWDDKFSKANAALNAAASRNGNGSHFAREVALNYAYEHLSSGVINDDTHALGATLTALMQLNPAQILLDFSDYLVLRSAIPEGDLSQYFSNSDIDARRIAFDTPALAAIFKNTSAPVSYDRKEAERGGKNQQHAKYVTGPFDVQREIIDLLKRPVEDHEERSHSHADGEGILMVKVANQQGIEVPEKVLHLLTEHLLQLPDSALRMSETTFVSLAKDPLLQIRAMVDFMQSLEEYNAVASPAERFNLAGCLQLTRPLGKSDHRANLAAFIDCMHLLRYAQRSMTQEAGAGMLLLHADEARLLKLKSSGVNLIFMDRVRLLPGKEAACAELIWRNPLAQLKEGQVYEFGRYAIHKRLLKHSSYGTYLATDVELDRPAAMKIVTTQDAAAFRQKDDLRGKIYERIRAIARLSHPYIAYVQDMGERDGILYVAREYIEGDDLSEVTFHEEHRDGEILVLLQKIVRALIYAESKGVLHLNLKPGNIWLSDAQDLRITDFRIPGFTEDATTSHVLVPAHWRYAAPEILLGDAGDSRSDIYSLGVLAYELIAGRHPYSAAKSIQSPHDLLKLKIAPLTDCEKPHHRGWDNFVMRAIQRQAEKRFQNLAEMDDALRAIQMEMLQRDLNGS